MAARPEKREPVAEVWLFSSELEGERAGAHRQVRWARVFLEAGARLRIFNLRGAFRLSETPIDGIEEFDTFRREVVARGPRVSGIREGALVPVLRRIKHLLLADLFLPNVFRLFVRARRRLDGLGGRVVIMPSSPPFAVVAVAAMMKRLRPAQVLLAIDMRDAWSLHPELRGNVWLKRNIERWALRSADHVSTMSNDLAAEMSNAHGLPVQVYYNVATHYFDVPPRSEFEWSTLDARIDARRRKIVYTGSIPEGFYDVAPFVAAAKQLRLEHPDLADRLQYVFVGPCNEVVREVARQGATASDFIFTALVPHETAKAIQQNADAFLFFAFNRGGNKGIVSTKFFEYLALGIPMLALAVSPGSDIDRLLLRYSGRTSRLRAPGDIADALAHVAEGRGREHLPWVGDPRALHHLADDYRVFVRNVLGGSGCGSDASRGTSSAPS